MTAERSLSVIIPAYCEQDNILATLGNVRTALEPLNIRHEVLVIDDGSSDGTGDIVRTHAAEFPAVTLLQNPRNMGFGWTYRRGVQSASLSHIVMVHGDNAWGWETLRALFARVGEADIVVGYTRDMWHTRSWTRTVISKAFTFAVNLITWRWLRYYNGLQIHEAQVLKNLTIESTGYGFQAEVLVKALRVSHSIIEVPMDLMERDKGESKAFRVKNVVDVVKTLGRLVRVQWGGR